MNQSVPGLLLRAAEVLKDAGDPQGYHSGLRALLNNLRELRDRTERGDLEALDEFFALYTFETGAEYKRADTLDRSAEEHAIMIPVYIAGPFAGDTVENARRACRLCLRAAQLGYAPMVVHPAILADAYGSDDDPEHRERGLQIDLRWVELVALAGGELWVIECNDGSLSTGTAREVAAWVDAIGFRRIHRRTWNQWGLDDPDLCTPDSPCCKRRGEFDGSIRKYGGPTEINCPEECPCHE